MQYGSDVSIAAPEKAWKLYRKELLTAAMQPLLAQQCQPKRHGLHVRLSRAYPARIDRLLTCDAGAPSRTQSVSCLCTAMANTWQ